MSHQELDHRTHIPTEVASCIVLPIVSRNTKLENSFDFVEVQRFGCSIGQDSFERLFTMPHMRIFIVAEVRLV
jgi:hypothetical protein